MNAERRTQTALPKLFSQRLSTERLSNRIPPYFSFNTLMIALFSNRAFFRACYFDYNFFRVAQYDEEGIL